MTHVLARLICLGASSLFMASAVAQSTGRVLLPGEVDHYLCWYREQRADEDDKTVFILDGRVVGVEEEGLNEVLRVVSAESDRPKRLFVFPNRFWLAVGYSPVGASDELLAVMGSSQLNKIKQSGVAVVFCPDWEFQFETPQGIATGAEKRKSDFTNSIGMKFVLIDVGSPVESSAAVRRAIRSNYFMGQCEVTQSQYQSIMKDNPSHFRGSDLPVDSVKWSEVEAFCQRLTNLEEEKQSGRVYTAPTVYEWEFACNAGRASAYFFDNTGVDLERYAWFIRNSGYASHEVGGLEPNAWGLYDTLGNVREWCRGLEREENAKVQALYRPVRGGGWKSPRFACSISVDDEEDEKLSRADIGFRIVCRQYALGVANRELEDRELEKH